MESIPAVMTVISIAVAVAAIIYARRKVQIASGEAQRARTTTEAELGETRRSLEAQRRELELAAKEDEIRRRERFDEETKRLRADLDKTKQRLDRREDAMERRKAETDKRAADLDKRQQKMAESEREVGELLEARREELERVAAMDTAAARSILLKEVEKEVRQESAELIRRLEEEARAEAERRAAEIVSRAIQRCAVDQTTETTVSVVALPSDEMKGRIIGREGRNIRCFEQVSGIDLIVDDTPEAVVLSGFDPVRREVAKIALEMLIADGRIHPGRIEETVERARRQTEERMREAAEKAAFETGVTGLHPEILKLVGKLRYRTSYGQNVLKHSIEVSHLARAMAEELGVRAGLARRAGFLHDIGKALDFERDGTHTQIGAEVAKARGEDPDVVHCIAAHHEDIEIQSIEAALVQAADAISASRPGARRETVDTYLKRLEGLESIASSFEGVEKVFAIQAGREIRVVVKPDKIDDLQAHRLAKGMAARVEGELDYPGQIRITVIRETRAVEYAK